MEHTQDKTGTLARITEDAKWTNYNTPTATLPAGTLVFIESWRPEGFNVKVAGTGEYFFLFKEYVRTAQEIKKGDTVFYIKQRAKTGCVSAYVVEAVLKETNRNISTVRGERNLLEAVYTEDFFPTRRAALEDLVSQAERLLNDVKAELEALEEENED